MTTNLPLPDPMPNRSAHPKPPRPLKLNPTPQLLEFKLAYYWNDGQVAPGSGMRYRF
jgi:hypothetical protein